MITPTEAFEKIIKMTNIPIEEQSALLVILQELYHSAEIDTFNAIQTAIDKERYGDRDVHSTEGRSDEGNGEDKNKIFS